ncbi:13251_t:CDS:1, partial [Racocetra fulgida]
MSSRNRNIKKKARAISKKVRRNWSVREKLMVVYYFERIKNVRATARRFDIEPKQVRDWRSKKQELLNAAPYLLTLNPGRPALYPLLERRLVEWVDVLRRKQAAITRNMVIRRAKKLAQTNEIKD